MTTETTSSPRKRKGLFFAAITLAALGLFAVNAVAGGGWGHCGAHGAMGATPDTKAAFVAERIADRADADDQQQAAIEAVLVDLFTDMEGLKADKETFRAQARDVLTAETVDVDALQDLRVRGMKTAEVASAQVVDALAEVASILTPEQRADLADDWDAMHQRWQR